MDLKMKAEEITTAGVSWDCKVQEGIVPLITGDEEEIQCATQAAFLISGTIPQLPEAGVPWADFLTKKITFGELDFYIRDSLQKVGKENYFPQYEIENDQLTMTVGKLEEENELYN